jgi:hypothetical protein
MPTADADVINYIPRRAALPDKPRKVSVSITRTAEGLWHTSMPVEDLDYLIALEFERQRQLADIADHNGGDAAEIARHSLFIEGHGTVRTSRISRKPNLQTKTRPKHRIP